LKQPWFERRVRDRDAHYHRPFIAIDSEGKSLAGNDIIRKDGEGNKIIYEDHRSFLWGASGVERVAPPSADKPHGEFRDLPLRWRGHADKRPLTLIEILDWLIGLPRQFAGADEFSGPDELEGGPIFISFAFNYDVTMILQAVTDYMPNRAYQKVYEICKKERLTPDQDGRKIKVKGHVYVGDYAIDWIQGKRTVIKKFRDRDDPKAGFSRRITIYDVFGFYQNGFLEVMKNLNKLGLATDDEVETIRRNKNRRKDFGEIPLDQIKTYTELELRKLSLAAIKLRDGFDFMGLRLHSWSGAGAASAALLKKEGVAAHYAGRVSKRDPSPEQLIAHKSYGGGHFEMIRQGCSEAGLHIYDLKNAYPYEMQELPSMIGGSFRWWSLKDNPDGLGWRAVETASKISAFFIRWRLPAAYMDKQSGQVCGIPFFPLFYRLESGRIVFPSEGSGWFMRDDAIGAKRWLETFVRLGLPGLSIGGLPRGRARDRNGLPYNLIITEAVFFDPDKMQPRPYAFIPRYYRERARLRLEEPGNVAEQNIKLTLNGLSGKAAQTIGGSEDKPPATACPWYASATTAGTRRRVMEAALQKPHAIVQFAADGIVSLEPLDLEIGEWMGQWEHKRVLPGTPAVFLLSGVYTYRTEGDENATYKARGMKQNFETLERLLLKAVTAAWAKPCDPANANDEMVVSFDQREFVSAGSAVAGRERFKLIGRWTVKPRKNNVHVPGHKRQLNGLKPELYYGTDERPARRCFELVETLPAMNLVENAYWVESKDARPKWLETEGIALLSEFAGEEEDDMTIIALGL
jgi:hypothetical protein